MLRTLVLVQAIVIALLLYLYLTKGERPRAPAQEGVGAAEQVEHGSAPVEVADAEPATKTAVPATPEADDEWTLVHGVIQDESGKPLDPCWVAAQGPGTARSVSALEGHYAIPGLVPGAWTLQIRTPSGATMDVPVELRRGRNRKDIVFKRPVQIRIVVETPEGGALDPFTEVAAVATRGPPKTLPMTDLRNHGTTFGLGAFRGRMDGARKLGPNEIGILTLKEDPPVFVSLVLKHVVLETREVRAPVTQLRFVVSQEEVFARTATVKVRFLDAETDEPVQVAVDLHDRQSRSYGKRSGKDGRFTWEHAPPGLMLLRVDGGLWESIHHRIRVPAGGELDLGTIRLHKAVAISGRIVDDAGRPVRGRLGVVNLDRLAFPQDLDTGLAIAADDDGKFTVSGAGRGRYLLLVKTAGWALQGVIVDTSGGAVDGVDIALERGVEVTLLPKPAPTEQPLLTVRDDAGVPVWTRRVRGTWPLKVVLAPGAYGIEVADDDGVRKTIPLEVGAEAVEIEIDP